jgi:hypothetical protein
MSQARVIRLFRMYRCVRGLSTWQAALCALAMCRALEEGR